MSVTYNRNDVITNAMQRHTFAMTTTYNRNDVITNAMQRHRFAMMLSPTQ